MFASIDIMNKYSNIPITETNQILDNMLSSDITDPRIKFELLDLYEIIRKQNYFHNTDKIIIQTDRLAMGVPSSGILTEIFLQHIEDTHLPHLAQKHELVNYFPFVGDILLIYDSRHTVINTILDDFNAIHPNLEFNEEIEQNNTINYPDITFIKYPRM
jgi:hypothetical protein